MRQAQTLEKLRERAERVMESDDTTEEQAENAALALNKLVGLDLLLDCPDYTRHVGKRLREARQLLEPS